jgi:hypothetical protein
MSKNRIVKIEPANDGVKKWIATFGDGKKTKFGSFRSPDYTLTGDKEQREAYRSRHRKDLDTGDPQRAGYLSYYILWGDSTSIKKNVADFNRRFA